MEPIENFPPLNPIRADKHPNEVNDTAFYTAALSDDPVNTFLNVKKEMETTGESPLSKAVQDRVNRENDEAARGTLASIIADESIDWGTKQRTLQEYALSGTITQSLRDKYIITTATRDDATTDSERRAQEIVIDTLYQRQQAADETQRMINAYGASLDPSKTKAFLGVVAEIAPGLYGYNVSKVYNELMRDGAGTTWERVMDGIWGVGSSEVEMAKFYQNLPVEQKKEFVKKLIDVAQDLPGFDFNALERFKMVLEGSDQHPFWTSLGNIAGVLDAVGLGWMAIRPVKTAKWFVPQLRVSPRSPLGTTATASPGAAKALAAGALADTTGQVAKALGTTQGEVVASYLLPKFGLENVPNLAEELAKMDARLSVHGVDPTTNKFLHLASAQADVDKMHTMVKEWNFPVYNPASSTLNVAELSSEYRSVDRIMGSSVYGKTSDYGYESVEEATATMARMQEKINTLPQGLKGKLSVVELTPSQHFIRWEWEREIDKVDKLVFGDGAISASFLGMDISNLARATGDWLIPAYDRLKRWVYEGATAAENVEKVIDQAMMKEVIRTIGPYRKWDKQLGYLLQKGATEVGPNGGKIFSYHEVLDMLGSPPPGLKALSVADAQEVFKGYMKYRVLADHHYRMVNEMDRARKARDGLKGVYDETGKLSLYARALSEGEIKDLKNVFDFNTGEVVKAAKVEGGVFVQLQKPMEVGGNLVTYANLARGSRLGPLPQRTLPYIEGYFPRTYLEYFWVDQVKKGLKVDGETVPAKDLGSYRKAVFSAKTQKEVEDFIAAKQLEQPDYEFTWRADRMDSDTAAIDDYNAFTQAYQLARSRGEHVITSGNQAAMVEDPLLALVKSLRNTAKRSAWAAYKDEFQRAFVRDYGDFLDRGKFPTSVTEINLRNPSHASKAETTRLEEAIEHYKYYSNVTEMTQVMSDRLWAKGMGGIADILDNKTKWNNSLLRDVGRMGNIPVRVLQKVGTILFLFTNPSRQIIAQSQQALELVAMRPTSAKEVFITHAGLLLRLAGEKLEGTTGAIVKKVSHMWGKTAGYSDEAFEKLYKQYWESGMVQGVDSNLMLHGMFNQADEALTATTRQKALSRAGAVAMSPIKLGKTLGYDPGELMNMTGAWLWARHRAAGMGMDVDDPQVLARITSNAREVTGSMTGTGALTYQKGTLAIPFQFAAIGHKLFLQPLTSKLLTPMEKAKLFTARIAFYGAYGTGAAVAFESLRDKYYDELPKETWDLLMGGLMDVFWNSTLEAVLGEGADLSVAPNLTPISPAGGLPYTEFLWAVMKEPHGFASKIPLFGLSGRFNQMFADLDMTGRDPRIDTKEKALQYIPDILRLSSGYSNYMQARSIIHTGKVVDKMGNDLDIAGSWKVAAGKIFGFAPEAEVALYNATGKMINRMEDLKKDAKLFHNTMERKMRAKGTFEDPMAYWVEQSMLFSTLPEEDQALFKEFFEKEDRQALAGRGFSVVSSIHKQIQSEASTDMINLMKQLSDHGSIGAREVIEILKAEGVVE